MYVIGGEFDNCTSDGASVVYSTCETYDPTSNTVESIATLNTARTQHCACVFNGKIFVMGKFQYCILNFHLTMLGGSCNNNRLKCAYFSVSCRAGPFNNFKKA